MNRAALVFIAAAVIVSSSGCCVLDRLFCGGCRPYLGCNRFQGCAEPPSNCGGCCGDGGCSSGGCGSGPMLGSRLFGGCGGGCASGDCGSGGCGPRFGGLFTSGCRSCGSGVSGRHYSAGCRSCGGGRAHGANPYGGGYAGMGREGGQQIGNPYGSAAGGPPTAQVAYPYYTTRGPRDFLANNPGYPSN